MTRHVLDQLSKKIMQKTIAFRARARQSRLSAGYARNPHMSALDKAVVDDLLRSGIHVSSLDQLKFEKAGNLLATLNAPLNGIKNAVPDSEQANAQPFMVLADPIALASEAPEVLLWGLQNRILDIVEAYMAQPTHCLGVFVRRDLVDGNATGTRRWHYDYNDFKYVKLIIYLNDVSEDHGPFEYVPEAPGKARPRDVCGPAGTVILVDTARLRHRGRVPGQERLTLFYSYASRAPSRPDLCNKVHFLPGLAHLSVPLTARQTASLPATPGPR